MPCSAAAVWQSPGRITDPAPAELLPLQGAPRAVSWIQLPSSSTEDRTQPVPWFLGNTPLLHLLFQPCPLGLHRLLCPVCREFGVLQQPAALWQHQQQPPEEELPCGCQPGTADSCGLSLLGVGLPALHGRVGLFLRSPECSVTTVRLTDYQPAELWAVCSLPGLPGSSDFQCTTLSAPWGKQCPSVQTAAASRFWSKDSNRTFLGLPRLQEDKTAHSSFQSPLEVVPGPVLGACTWCWGDRGQKLRLKMHGWDLSSIGLWPGRRTQISLRQRL